MVGDGFDDDSDKENKDPSSVECLQLTPTSAKKKMNKRKKRKPSFFCPSNTVYPLDLTEVYIFYLLWLMVIVNCARLFSYWFAELGNCEYDCNFIIL